MGRPAFHGKGPQTFSWSDSEVARGKITMSGIPNGLKYRSNLIMYTQFTNVAAGRMTRTGVPRVGPTSENFYPVIHSFLRVITASVATALVGQKLHYPTRCEN